MKLKILLLTLLLSISEIASSVLGPEFGEIGMSSNVSAQEFGRRADVLEKNISGLDSLIWILNHNEKHFPIEPDWEIDFEQAKKDGLNYVTLSTAATDGKLSSQAAYNELVRINKLDEFHSKNVKYRFGEPVKIIGLIIVLFISFLLLRRLIKKT